MLLVTNKKIKILNKIMRKWLEKILRKYKFEIKNDMEKYVNTFSEKCRNKKRKVR